jgi:hypothetical protein
MRYLPALLTLPLLLSLPACGGDDDDGGGSGSQADAGGGGTADAGGSGSDASAGSDAGTGADASAGEDLELQASDFKCIKDGTKVHQFYMTNPLGHLDDAVAVADSKTGGAYPVGTVIQLLPQEAMVKRAAGWNPDTSDWEFFLLSVTGTETTIDQRGGREVSNAFDTCFNCHSQAEPQWDLVCEKTHGCDPLPIGDDIILQLQNADTRCL